MTMQKVFYLKNCSTNKKIMAALDLENWELREIKTNPITKEELEEMQKLSGSYEALFSKKSTQIKARNLVVKSLNEEDFKHLILEHYSFLKRPVFMTNNAIFIGNEKDNVENLYQTLI
jgi:arsenate reductase-like glutaredoxin family protein